MKLKEGLYIIGWTNFSLGARSGDELMMCYCLEQKIPKARHRSAEYPQCFQQFFNALTEFTTKCLVTFSLRCLIGMQPPNRGPVFNAVQSP